MYEACDKHNKVWCMFISSSNQMVWKFCEIWNGFQMGQILWDFRNLTVWDGMFGSA